MHLSKGNTLLNRGAWIDGIRIYIHGTGNKIEFGEKTRIKDCVIQIYGNNNSITIGSSVLVNNGTFWMEDDRNAIVLNDCTTINGKTEFAAIEGTSIHVGEDCMFSSDITIRTGDSHSILDQSGSRINPSESIILGDHVWVGAQVTILKGAHIMPHSVVGTGAIVTKNTDSVGNAIMAGIPARVVKTHIDWDRKRI